MPTVQLTEQEIKALMAAADQALAGADDAEDLQSACEKLSKAVIQ